jgi:aminotransferase
MTKLSDRVQGLQQSGIRAASKQCYEIGGINLGQGVCDLPILDEIKQAAHFAIDEDKSIYSPCEGIPALREKIAHKIQNFNQISINPAEELIVTHGSTGAFFCAITAAFNPGDEVILFEPFYGYHKNLLKLQHINVKAVPINLTDLSIDFDKLRAAITPNTRGIVICTPCNPSGKVFSLEELLAIGELVKEHNLLVITDEIYEYITYPGKEHISFASLQDFKHCTLTISGLSKTYNMTGWRLGYVSGPAHLIAKMALVQDLVYICPNTPLQYATLAAFDQPAEYYKSLATGYLKKRDLLVDTLKALDFSVVVPEGAYYLLADFKAHGFKDDNEAMQFVMTKAKVATVTGRSFYVDPEDGKHMLRFCYALHEDKITAAVEQLKLAFS